ncbi:cytochrome P450 3A4-like [Ornithorhynchus anatinus]|uniref:Thromboxane-A synthase n=1 Tax=Ornithorhynchus anatinus TaxID=9258 RepID=F7AFG1_ORNAN|nr:cytochrome P450 3A4-like [Ornithorhynchus anatinus]
MSSIFSFSIETWILLGTFLTLMILYGIWPYGVFTKRNIPGPWPVPFLGNIQEYSQGLMVFDKKCSEKYGKIWGLYEGRQAIIAVLDLDIIKKVLVKEVFSSFTNRRNTGIEGILELAVSSAEDEHWKELRTLMSRTFTSGKLKEMLPIMTHYGEVLVRNIWRKAEKNENVTVKDYFGAYSLDVITSTSFGVDVDSLNKMNDTFVKEIKKISSIDFFSPLFALISTFPFMIPLLKLLNINLFPNDSVEYFKRFLHKVKERRHQDNQQHRVDFLQLMLDSQNPKEGSKGKGGSSSWKGLSDAELLAQAFAFIFAGYETSSNTLSFISYNLATHPDVQEKLQAEIDTVLPNKSPLTYDALVRMEYLDMVINESLRLYPISSRLERMCKKTTEINGLTIPKGTCVVIPLFILQNDPNYWLEPDEFHPERFSKEMRDKRDPYTFMPFGAGPRNCIGMRFALLSIKVAMIGLLKNFSLRTCQETQIPPEINSFGLLTAKKPIVLRYIPRADTKIKD